MALFDLLATTRSSQQKLEDTISTKNIEQLKRLLEDGVDPDIKLHKFGGDRAIHLAATKGNVEIIELLIHAGSVCDLPNDSDITPLYNSFRANHSEALKVLMKHCRLDKRLNYLWVEGLYLESKISEDYAIQAVQIVSAPNLLFQSHHLRPTYWDVYFTLCLSNMSTQSLACFENIKLLFLTGFERPDSVFLTYEKKISEKLDNLETNVQWLNLNEDKQAEVVAHLKDLILWLSFRKTNPSSLTHLCRLAIRGSFWNKCNVFYGTHRLPLPTQLKAFILFDQ